MPNKKSAFKRLRQDEKKYKHNHAKKSALRTLAKKARKLMSEKEMEKASEVLNELESKLDKAAKTKTIKKNTASRRISRLRKQWSKLQEAKS